MHNPSPKFRPYSGVTAGKEHIARINILAVCAAAFTPLFLVALDVYYQQVGIFTALMLTAFMAGIHAIRYFLRLLGVLRHVSDPIVDGLLAVIEADPMKVKHGDLVFKGGTRKPAIYCEEVSLYINTADQYITMDTGASCTPLMKIDRFNIRLIYLFSRHVLKQKLPANKKDN